MTAKSDRIEESDQVVACNALSVIARSAGLSIATAESLTSGNLAALLGRGEAASEWYRGGVVAYSKAVKHSVLHVPLGPAVSEGAAKAMAHTVATMMGANLAIALTGEGGPEPQEQPPGTVWFGVADHGVVFAERQQFGGSPGDILDATIDRAIQLLRDRANLCAHSD